MDDDDAAAMHPYARLPSVYLKRRRPCFLCSRSLQRLGWGPHKGHYVAKEVVIDGLPRFVHGRCSDLQDHQPRYGDLEEAE